MIIRFRECYIFQNKFSRIYGKNFADVFRNLDTNLKII